MQRIFTPVKIQWLRPGLNPQTWVPEASMLTTRPPKPSPEVETGSTRLHSVKNTLWERLWSFRKTDYVMM